MLTDYYSHYDIMTIYSCVSDVHFPENLREENYFYAFSTIQHYFCLFLNPLSRYFHSQLYNPSILPDDVGITAFFFIFIWSLHLSSTVYISFTCKQITLCEIILY